MRDAIIVVNAGSSSLKFSVYSVVNDALALEARGQIEGLGTSPHFKVKDHEGHVLEDRDLQDFGREGGHAEAFAQTANWMRDYYRGELSPIGVGHRIVHGGLAFSEPALIDADFMAKVEPLVPLMPLHLPHNLAGVRGVTKLRPDLPQVACFDTSFHRGRARVTERFALPDEWFQRGVRRWGFHGLSYEYIAAKFQRIAPKVAKGRVIVAHLGSGASLCAMKDGRSVDTTMSFSALDGLPMGTRCGALDPGVVFYLLGEMTLTEAQNLLYKKAGLLGISGVSNDVRDLLASDNPLAAEAIDYFVYRVIREIGSLTAALEGLDALVFTAGVGENSPVVRERICDGLAWLGIRISAAANSSGRTCVTADGATPSVWVIPTDEEIMIGTHTLRMVASLAHAHAL